MQQGTSQNHPEDEKPRPGAAISPEEVEAELQKILASPVFCKASRHSRFLTFVVRKTLEGSTDSVKESVIGVKVFDREADYNPGAEPAVRVEAGRLRSRLSDYYKTLGRDDPIRIDLPRGTYVPVFSRNLIAPEATASDPHLQGSAAETRRHAVAFAGNGPWLRWLAAAAVTLLVAILAGYAVSRRPAKFADKDSIVLTDFDNKTGDAVFDDTLKQGLSIHLQQSPFFYLVPDRKVNATLKLMGRPSDGRLTPQVAREVCVRTASTAMLTGSIAKLGSQYVIGLKAVSCNNGDLLAEAQESAASKDDVLKALDAGAITLRGQLGESLSSVEKYATPLKDATTPSLEALKAYSLGLKTNLAKGDTAALPFFKRAVELDPSFAVAYNAMSGAYNNLSEPGRAQENARKAYELRDKVSERERLSIEATTT